MNLLQEPIHAIVSEKVTHQHIGGKEITLEREGTLAYLIDKPMSDWTIAEYNFFKRRPSLFIMTTDEEVSAIKIYYGHVGNLGYFVVQDELEMI